jgi:hypothetical protein
LQLTAELEAKRHMNEFGFARDRVGDVRAL